MRQYLNLLNSIVVSGTRRENRTGVYTRSLLGQTLRFEDINGNFPLITTKRVPFRMIFEETMFFLRGDTQTKKLEEKGIKIWTGNTTRSFLDSRGLYHLEEGDMGKGYGHQIRNFASSGYDQLTELIRGLREDPWDRRHIISHWCPSEVKDAALPPCHIMHMYTVEQVDKEFYLDSSFVMRSTDTFHGLPFNIASYALINILLANCCGYKPRNLVYFGHDVHVYETHLDVVAKQLEREPYTSPRVLVKNKLYQESVAATVEELSKLTYEDIELIGYQSHKSLKAEMVV